MLGIVVALPWELKSLTRARIAPGSCKAAAPRTLIAVSGMGAERARAAAALLIAQGATALMGWGYAAGLDSRLDAGSLVLPERVLGAGGESYPVDAEWHSRAYLAAGFKVPVWTGTLAESAAIVATPAEKRALGRRTGASAADMESAAHARAAAERALPYLAVRAIVDTASTEIPGSVLPALEESGALDGGKFFRAAPADWLKILRLGMQFRAAQSTLKKASKAILSCSSF